MSSLKKITELKALNEGNFVKNNFDPEKEEFVVSFRNNGIKLPKDCFIAHGKIFDREENIKVCRIAIE